MPSKPTTIPKHIHQIWIGPKDPPAALMETWQANHPDWKYTLWNEDTIEFPLRNQEQYDASNSLNGKSDVLRYEILHKYGGVYIDADTISLRPLEDDLLSWEFFSCYESEKARRGVVASGVIGCIPGSEILAEAIRRISALSKETITTSPAWITVGPMLLTETLKAYHGHPGLKIFPSHFFLPEHFSGVRSEWNSLSERPFATHLWGTTTGIYDQLAQMKLDGQTTITGVAIVKDEEQGLKNTLPCVGKYCDHLFLAVDDRTTDRTTDVITNCGHPSVAYELVPWVDFGANRNVSMQKALEHFPDTDWFIVFDGHEEIGGISEEELRFKLASQSPDVDGLSVSMDIGTEKTYGVFRILRRHIRYHGPVHEYPVLEKSGGFSGLGITHRSDLISKESGKFRSIQRQEFYIEKMKPLAEKGEPRYIYHLTMAYHDMGGYREALEWAGKYEGPFDSERFACFAYGMKSAIQLKAWQEGLRLAKKESFHRPDYYFLRAWLHYGAGELEPAGLYYGLALVTPMPERPAHVGVYVTKALCEENLKRLSRSLWQRDHPNKLPAQPKAQNENQEGHSPPSNCIRAYWLQLNNFGDQLTQLLLQSYGFQVQYSSPEEAQLIGIGSILENVPSDFRGFILGAGFMLETSRIRFSQAKILAVRGRLSAEACNAPRECILADPGLLVGRFFLQMPDKTHEIGIVPHYGDKGALEIRELAKRLGQKVKIIDVESHPIAVLQEIAGCDHILSSSLHGLVTADAFGIPNRWIELSDKVLGDGFKFRDYYSAFEETRTPFRMNGLESVSDLKKEMQKPGELVGKRISQLNGLFSGSQLFLEKM